MERDRSYDAKPSKNRKRESSEETPEVAQRRTGRDYKKISYYEGSSSSDEIIDVVTVDPEPHLSSDDKNLQAARASGLGASGASGCLPHFPEQHTVSPAKTPRYSKADKACEPKVDILTFESGDDSSQEADASSSGLSRAGMSFPNALKPAESLVKIEDESKSADAFMDDFSPAQPLDDENFLKAGTSSNRGSKTGKLPFRYWGQNPTKTTESVQHTKVDEEDGAEIVNEGGSRIKNASSKYWETYAQIASKQKTVVKKRLKRLTHEENVENVIENEPATVEHVPDLNFLPVIDANEDEPKRESDPDKPKQ